MELGLTTFAEITDSSVSAGERLRQVVEEAKLADELGLEIYAIAEHRHLLRRAVCRHRGVHENDQAFECRSLC